MSHAGTPGGGRLYHSAAGDRHVLLVLLAMLAAAVAGTAVFLMIGVDSTRVASALLPELRQTLAVHDSAAQRSGYAAGLAVFVVAIALACLAGRAATTATAPPRLDRTAAYAGLGILVLAFVIWMTQSPILGESLVWGRYFGVRYRPGWLDALLAVATCLGGLALIRAVAPRWRGRLATGLLVFVLAYAALLAGLGLFRPFRLDFATDVDLSFMLDAHLAALLGDRQQLSSGMQLFDLVQPYYGFLWPVLTAIFERHAGWMSVGQSLRLVQASQILFLLVFLLALLRMPHRTKLGIALAMLAVVPWVHSLHISLITPNQAGFRYLGMPIALLALGIAARRTAIEGALLLGAAGSLAVLINHETGAALTFGLAYFLWLRCEAAPGWRVLAQLALRFAGGFFLVQAAFWLIAFAGLGQSPRPFHLLLWPLVSDIEPALLGLRLYLDPMMLAILGHAAFLVGRAALVQRVRPNTPEEAVIAAMGLSILIWMAYWSARPDPWNSWSYLPLYAPFLLHLARPRQEGRLAQPGALALAGVMVPLILLANVQPVLAAYRATLGYARPDRTLARPISGIWLPIGMADRLRCKADLVQEAQRGGRTVFVSAHSYVMPTLIGQAQRLTVREVFFGVSSPARYARFVAEITALQPARILIDDETPPVDIAPAQRLFFDGLVARFERDGFVREPSFPSGWIALRRPGAEAVPPLAIPPSCRPAAIR